MNHARRLFLVWFAVWLWLSAATALSAQEADGFSRAGLVVVISAGDGQEGQVIERCVAFPEAQISGYELLQRADLPLVIEVVGQGVQMCSIADVGCPSDNCFCGCQGGADCRYWSYWQVVDGGWRYATVGAGGNQLRHGQVDGWVWGLGGVDGATAPPARAFTQICGLAQPAAAPGSPPPAAEPAAGAGWPALAVFGLLVAILGAGLLRRRRA